MDGCSWEIDDGAVFRDRHVRAHVNFVEVYICASESVLGSMVVERGKVCQDMNRDIGEGHRVKDGGRNKEYDSPT